MEDISEEENEATSQEDVSDYHQKEFQEQREHNLYQLKSLQGQLLDNLIAYVSDSNESVSPDIRQRILSSIKRDSTTSCDTQTTQLTAPSSYPDSLNLSHSNVSHGDSSMLRDTSSGTLVQKWVTPVNSSTSGFNASSGTLVQKWATPVNSSTSGFNFNSRATITSPRPSSSSLPLSLSLPLSSDPSLPPASLPPTLNESESPLPGNSTHNSPRLTPPSLTPPFLTPPKQVYNPITSPETKQQAFRSPLSSISNNNTARDLIPKTLVPNPTSMEVLVSENESLRIRNGQLNEELEQFNRFVVYFCVCYISLFVL